MAEDNQLVEKLQEQSQPIPGYMERMAVLKQTESLAGTESFPECHVSDDDTQIERSGTIPNTPEQHPDSVENQETQRIYTSSDPIQTARFMTLHDASLRNLRQKETEKSPSNAKARTREENQVK